MHHDLTTIQIKKAPRYWHHSILKIDCITEVFQLALNEGK